MKIFNFFKRKTESTVKEAADKLSIDIKQSNNIANNDELSIQPSLNSIIAITPEYSDKVPPEFSCDEKLEFLNYINTRPTGNLSHYRTSRFKDYKEIIEDFYHEGYLEFNHMENLKLFKVVELKEILKDHHLKVSGKKLDLIERIIEHTDEEAIKANYNYKERYILSSTAYEILEEYHDKKDKYNDIRDEIIYQEELKKDTSDEILLLKFEDLENSSEFKSSLSKAMLLSKFRGERYENTVRKFSKQYNEKLKCPKLDEFLEKPDGVQAKMVSSYEEKLQLYIMYQFKKSKYLHLEQEYLKLNLSNINLKMISQRENCKCSICPPEDNIYTKEDYINSNIPQYPHHYGCMCLVTIDLS